MSENFNPEQLNPEQNAIEIVLDTPDKSGGDFDRVRLLAIGAPEVVTALIHTLHKRGFAAVGDWSKLLPGRHPGEVMSVFTWSIRLLNSSENERKVR
ncbi:hypothetical protein H6F67_12085 [Microcoleus sp. FACHB-1515]|uniref:hypothetical protein n=1 Tax=Cyanophyceae TaxID=3028117 RepID=UPI001686D6FD|nr:hypothetical protein [Microcoleus sp. FACHB-1515]MBD2090593.1 hypothetical protein [Microcoleus sp. FACHB-1515]